GGDIPAADLAALGLVGREQLRSAPAAQRAFELPGEIDRVSHAAVHAEAAGRDHEMHRVAGEEHAAVLVALGEQQVLLPFADAQHLVFHRHADRPLELRRHVAVVGDRRVQRPVARRVLHDEESRALVGDVVVAAVARAVADWNALVKLVAAIERLAQAQDVGLATQLDAELPAHRAAAAVAADQVLGSNLPLRRPRGDASRILLERLEFTAISHRAQALGDRLEQRLERVLRDELVRLERHRAVVARFDRPARFAHRGIGRVHERRQVQRAHDVDVHRHLGLPAEVPMDVYIVRALNLPALMHSPYPSVSEARRAIEACNDGTMPLEPYQLVSQYTLEPLLKSVAEGLCSVRYGCEFQSFEQDAAGVTARTSKGEIRARYLVGCDGGSSRVRQQLGIELRGEADILRLRQALYRCDELYQRIPIGNGPGHGRHYHVADERST